MAHAVVVLELQLEGLLVRDSSEAMRMTLYSQLIKKGNCPKIRPLFCIFLSGRL